MAKDKIHKLEAKFRNGILNYEDAPMYLRKKWDRHNFHLGKYRRMRRDKKSRDFE
jgi:hypothetical protein